MSIISDYKQPPKSKSYSHSQILYKDYNADNIKIIILEMIEVLTARLRNNNKLTRLIGFGIGYSKEENGGFYHSLKLENGTESKYDIYRYIIMIFDKFYLENMPIRKVCISLGKLETKSSIQLCMFNETENIEKFTNINNIIDDVKKKFGKNSIINTSALTEDSTAIERNKKIGGHRA